MRLNLFMIMVVVAVSAFVASGAERSDNLKPRWMTGNLPEATAAFIFQRAQGTGRTLEEARRNALSDLVSRVEHERGIKVTNSQQLSYEMADGNVREREAFQMEISENGQEIRLSCKGVDEYWEAKDGRYTVTDLFTINTRPDAGLSADNVRLTTSYGAAPVFYSIIPGVGQIYKGSVVKGSLILGGSALCVAATILCESQRAHYAKRMKENPEYVDFYRDRKSSWETGRNVAIGAAAALYIYNLIDAAIAPGRRRVVIDKKRYEYSFGPVITSETIGAGLAINF